MKLEFIKKNKILQILICLLLSGSVALFSTYLMINSVKKLFIIATIILSFAIVFYLIYTKRNQLLEKVFKDKIALIIGTILGLIIFYEYRLHASEQIKLINAKLFSIPHLHYLIIPGILLITIVVSFLIKNWIIDFYNRMDKWDKKLYIIFSIISFALIFYLYSKTDMFYTQYDKIYSIDSGFIFNKVLLNSHYYDIRHPLLGIIAFPVYSTISFIFSSSLQPMIIQFINTQLLLLIAFELKQLTNKRIVFFLYLFSFSSLLLTVFLEKYILCVFFIVTYLYHHIIKNKSDAYAFSFAAGCMPTSAYIGLMEIFSKNKIKEKIINIVKLGITTVSIFIVSGRIHVFRYGLEEMISKKNGFASQGLSIGEKLTATFSMIKHCFIAMPSKVINQKFMWSNVTGKVSLVAILVFIVLLIGIKSLRKYNKALCYSFVTALIFSFVLFVGLNWSVHESPLFSFYFSWAIIPLFVFGFEQLLEWAHIKEKYYKYIYILMIMFMIYKDIPIIIKLLDYINI